jgi:hypothetical protein
MRLALTILLAATVASLASAQTDATYLLTSSNTVSPTTPTTTIEVWGKWNGPSHVFALGDYDLVASEGAFSDPTAVLSVALNTAGVVGPAHSVTGAVFEQLFLAGSTPLSDNPILLASYTWSTFDFTPRSADIRTTSTSRFVLANSITWSFAELFPNNFTPGTGVITIVPAPAAWLVLALPLVGMRRRR